MPEFDRISEGYSAGFDDPLKKLLGDSARSFLAPKIKLLAQQIRQERSNFGSRQGNLLDFGCGAGDFLSELSETFPAWSLEGCDVSTGMLAEARKRLSAKTDKIKLWEITDNHLPTNAYDVVTVVCVLHHILPEMWSLVLQNIAAALRAGGILAIFEHNPWNPVTRWMVSRTEVDRNAILLSAPLLKRIVRGQQFKLVTVQNFLFYPPRLSWLSFSEAWLSWLPMGGQYALFARKGYH
jgi:SAM-dependent methyltransferase